MALDDRVKFGTVERARRIWAVGAVHGEFDRLSALHQRLARGFRAGDRLVYLGNYLGRGARIVDTIDEMLLFRRALMARFSLFETDVQFLRGSQEEMWQKLLQLQLAQSPAQVFEWMITQGVEATLRAYGVNPDSGRMRCRDGPLALARWSLELREAIRAHAGHEQLLSALRRAAYTDDGHILFVHAGIDTSRPLAAQTDSFWWGGGDFAGIVEPYEGFSRIVRGFDPGHGGVDIGVVAATVDSGCGFGGPLTAICLERTGEVVEAIEG
ncbi:MAG TPA: hypothetical protein VGB88_05010 [Alphaproteobacteria bacterium]